MHTFYIQRTKTFDAPSASQPKGCCTTYYIANKKEKDLLAEYVNHMITIMTVDLSDPALATESAGLYSTALKKHNRKSGVPYTLADIIMDLHEQLRTQKDPTESMITRWNLIFTQLGVSELKITIADNTRPSDIIKPKLPNRLFE